MRVLVSGFFISFLLYSKIALPIVAGEVASEGEFPSFVMLWVDGAANNQDANYVYSHCGGSLIEQNKVLTAAHCVDGFLHSQLYASTNFYSFSDSSVNYSTLIPIAAGGVAIHENYPGNGSKYDVAILTLSSAVNSSVARIYGGSTDLTDLTVTTSGAGLTQFPEQGFSPEVRKVSNQVTSDAVCELHFGSEAVGPSNYCTDILEVGRGECLHDSGSPNWIQINGTTLQAGIVIRGLELPCAYPPNHVAFVQLSQVESFIRRESPGAIIVEDDEDTVLDLILPILPVIIRPK